MGSAPYQKVNTMPFITCILRSNRATLVVGKNKDRISRLSCFADWLDAQGRTWYTPDLAAYRDYLASEGLRGSSIQAHLSTIRGRYAELLRDNQTRDEVMNAAAAHLPADASVADILAVGNEALTRLQNAIDPKSAPVKMETKRDHTDAEHLRLTVAQANTLLAAPDVGTVKGVRDTAIIAMLLCTGIREQELCNLELGDLRQRKENELALYVREGKGAETRLVPYGALDWCLVIVDKWLSVARITEGPVFCAVTKGSRVRLGPLTTRAVQQIIGGYLYKGKRISGYPIMVDGGLRYCRPHDLRRTYARRLYDTGMSVEAIQQNLGHASRQTTLDYIGDLDFEQRKPPAVYTFNLDILKDAPVVELKLEGGKR
jgi:site-specific recombinase XerD